MSCKEHSESIQAKRDAGHNAALLMRHSSVSTPTRHHPATTAATAATAATATVATGAAAAAAPLYRSSTLVSRLLLSSVTITVSSAAIVASAAVAVSSIAIPGTTVP